MINIGTLSAFVLVSIGIVVLRKRRPDLPRAFKVPGSPVVPILSAALCFWLMLNLTTLTWVRFAIWLAIGLAIYFLYGRSHSRLNHPELIALEHEREEHHRVEHEQHRQEHEERVRLRKEHGDHPEP